MSKLYKVLTLAVVIVLTLTLSACKKDGISDKLKEDKTTLLLAVNESMVIDDIDLPTEGKNGSTITWKSSNTNVIADDGTVTRPAYGTTEKGYEVVTLTATLKLNKEKTTKEFRLRVIEAPEKIGVNIAGVLQQAKGTDITLENVIVFGKIASGFFVYDDTGFMYVYGTPTDNIKVGDKVNFLGTYDIYYTQPEIKDMNAYEVISSNNPMPTPVVKTIAEINNFETSDKTIYSKYYTVEGIVKVVGSGNNQDVYLVNGDDKINIHYSSNDEALKSFEGKKIQINAILLTYHTGDQEWQFCFVGDTDDITEKVLTPQEKMDAAYDGLTLPAVINDDLELVTQIGDVAISWASDNEDVIATDGKVTRTDKDETVKLTATLSLTGVANKTKEFTITVLKDEVLTLAEVFSTKKAKDLVDVQGIVYELMGTSGFFLSDGTHQIYVYENPKELKVGDKEIAIGDKVRLTGAYDIYKEQPEIVNVTTVTTITDDDLVVPTATPSTISAIKDIKAKDKTAYGDVYTVKGTVKEITIGSYTDIYIEDILGNQIKVYYGSDANDVKALKDKFVEIEVVLYRYSTLWEVGYFKGNKLEETVAFTDREKLDYVKADLKLPVSVTTELTLPKTLAGVEIAWTSNNEAIAIATDGTVTVTQPTDANVTVTLTATFTIGSETDTKEIEVIVKAPSEAVAEELFFSEYIEGSSNNKAIEIYNGTGEDVDLSQYKVELYSNGATTATNTLELTGTLVAGEVYIIYNAGAADAIKNKGDVSSTVTYFNGDDVLVLKKGDTVIDSIGKLGEDPGTNWKNADGSVATSEKTLVRKPTITAGDTNLEDDFDPSVEWIAYPSDTFDYLGSHTVGE